MAVVYRKDRQQWMAMVRYGRKQVWRTPDENTEASAKVKEAELIIERERQRLAEGGKFYPNATVRDALNLWWGEAVDGVVGAKTQEYYRLQIDQRIVDSAEVRQLHAERVAEIVGANREIEELNREARERNQRRAARGDPPWYRVRERRPIPDCPHCRQAVFIGDEPITALTRRKLGAWRKSMVAAGHGNRSINAAISTAKAAIGWAIDNDVVDLARNPLSHFEGVEEEVRDAYVFEHGELDAIAAALTTDEVRTLHYVLAYTGQRIGAAVLLERRQIRFADGGIYVRHLKGKREEVRIPMIPRLALALEWYVAQLPKGRQRLFDLTPVHARRLWKRAAGAAGYPWAVPHMLRHGVVSLIAATPGGTIQMAAEIVGHSTEYMTHRYSWIFDKQKDAVMRRMQTLTFDD